MIVKIILRIAKILWILCNGLYIIYDVYNSIFQKSIHLPNVRKYYECIKTVSDKWKLDLYCKFYILCTVSCVMWNSVHYALIKLCLCTINVLKLCKKWMLGLFCGFNTTLLYIYTI